MTNALILIDLQESFRAMPSWSEISHPDIVTRANRLVDAARQQGDVIVWVLHSTPRCDGPFNPDKGLVVLQSGLHFFDDDIYITKTSHNAFTSTNLDQVLRQLGVTSLRLCGIRTEQCVETTARIASDMGYLTEVVIDACATHPLPLASGTGQLDPEEVTERTAAALLGRFASIVTIDEVVRN